MELPLNQGRGGFAGEGELAVDVALQGPALNLEEVGGEILQAEQPGQVRPLGLDLQRQVAAVDLEAGRGELQPGDEPELHRAGVGDGVFFRAPGKFLQHQGEGAAP